MDMDEDTKAAYENKCQEIRAELKRWENDWTQTHDGSKPGRQDIKDNPDIARRYKDYNRYRDLLSGKLPLPRSNSDAKPPKRKPDAAPASAPAETPLKRTRYAETPSKQRAPDEELMNTPAIARKLFSPAPVTSLGPTPQRDGRVLGLFDLLVERELHTPSKHNTAKASGTPSRRSRNAPLTPRKRTSSDEPGSAAKLGQTPMSASKKQMLSAFATPSRTRRGSFGSRRTPSSVSKLQFDTPAFLKRHSLPAVDENAVLADPAPLRLPRKPLVRGLSEIVASLRRVEEDALDDDLEALREVEEDAAGQSGPAKSPAGRPSGASAPAVGPPGVAPRTRPVLLGAFDDEDMYDSPVEDSVGRDGNPLPVFKKKGQKRTTRRVNMRPTMKKRPGDASQEPGSEDARDEDAVAETQNAAAPDGGSTAQDAGGSSDDEAAAKPAAKTKASTKAAGPVKKAVRKVNELAHANFQRLKLRNNGAKGGPGHNSRFRRRR
ncbi:uncharacterized protein UV8b_05143 [Ustilaginoidea virens]|uniref:DNA replication regulator SLD2 n=1 Tax=Ustilaginoidea virens TaxID=1159556 RepID=A0A1B5L6S5_USTVR|nr:uncharacterized protein UV8b_05143 [Ustilaginoidea virens]QUC20902.1 hypothetical protein UV8b_05143 [Ustilaginoidea virens]GAO19206.1 hypothetical protein UVI_02007990 [Ustilaginoidea virens]